MNRKAALESNVSPVIAGQRKRRRKCLERSAISFPPPWPFCCRRPPRMRRCPTPRRAWRNAGRQSACRSLQIYECKADAAGKLVWQFREPVATLIEDGKTIGVHYAGPSWQFVDGSIVTARLAARRAPIPPTFRCSGSKSSRGAARAGLSR